MYGNTISSNKICMLYLLDPGIFHHPPFFLGNFQLGHIYRMMNLNETGKSPKKEGKTVTRFGPVHFRAEKFAKEERFRWQKAQFSSDVVYAVPVEKTSKDIRFPTSTRRPLDSSEQFSTGPGQYDVMISAKYLNTARVSKFGISNRPNMVMKTPSPGLLNNLSHSFVFTRSMTINYVISLFSMDVGAVYNVKLPRSVGIGFNCDKRKDPGANSVTAEADMYSPKPDYGPAITIAKKISVKNNVDKNPGTFLFCLSM